jgi:hypothetical protein
MAWHYRNITTQTTTLVAGASVDLIAVIVNTAAASATATVYDAQAVVTGSEPKIATIDASAVGNFFYGCTCQRGIIVVTAGGTANITVIYDTYGQDGDD